MISTSQSIALEGWVTESKSRADHYDYGVDCICFGTTATIAEAQEKAMQTLVSLSYVVAGEFDIVPRENAMMLGYWVNPPQASVGQAADSSAYIWGRGGVVLGSADTAEEAWAQVGRDAATLSGRLAPSPAPTAQIIPFPLERRLRSRPEPAA